MVAHFSITSRQVGFSSIDNCAARSRSKERGLDRGLCAVADHLGAWRCVRLPDSVRKQDSVRRGQYELTLCFEVHQRDHATPTFQIVKGFVVPEALPLQES